MSFEIDIALRQGAFQLEAAFSAPQGLTALFGRSGSGKTTIVNAVAGLIRPERGHIRVGDRILYDASRGVALATRRRRIGYIFQDARLFPHLSVRRNLYYGYRLLPLRRRPAEPAHIVDILGLGALLDRFPAQLSGGEKQRVAIGRALLAAPELLLADEPLTGLDTPRKLEILPYFERIRDELKIPVLYVSHSSAEVARLATTVVVLDGGRVVQIGPPRDVLSDPSVVPTGVRNVGSILHARMVRHHADGLSELDAAGIPILVPRVTAASGASLRLRISAHEVILADRYPEGMSALNILPGTVAAIRSGEGPGALVTLDTQAGPLLARVTQRSVAALQLAPGRQAFAIVKSVAIAPEDIGSG
ncbi:molybdenum ABC transporter ATP-binding protein [Epibacterium sp. Ofav1-8]|uniref:molybdenum ABC transporter ATP-binding protein n=1 Tax=Epibacterium sp. Ofav1-8 TaxID=2917735 RepID=UPI001EF474E5|nr:molybdenum ABC transporter ATP-binding protein [Epibacterium sp. Ofav1-8]MCG7625419.1 molybdenum ABC transporter ATP-binding protein [Epibacterium sp. Ofav1-8]